MNNRLAWATPGHTREYCLNIFKDPEVYLDPYSGYIDRKYEQELAQMLGEGFYVSNRGTRIEILVPKDAWVDESRSIITEGTHQKVLDAVTEVFGETNLEINQVQPPVFKCLKGCAETFDSSAAAMKHLKDKHLNQS